MGNMKDIVAVMAIKTYSKDEIGTFRKLGESDNELMVEITRNREVEFVSEDDFEEPARKNFEKFINKILDGEYEDDKSLEIKFLTVLKDN